MRCNLPMFRAVIGAVGILQSQPGMAQLSNSPEIVVEGQKMDATISAFVEQLTPVFGHDQLATFIEPICPMVIGLNDEQARMVKDRIARVSETLKLPVGQGQCSANLFVIVSNDKREVIEGLKTRYPLFVHGVAREQLRNLVESNSPAVSWHVRGKAGTEGVSDLGGYRPAGGKMVTRKSGYGDGVSSPGFSTVGGPSRLRQMTKPYFAAAVVLIQNESLKGATPRQVADYSLMRALSPIEGTAEISLPAESILHLFESSPSQGAPSVTWWDLNFLKSLYGTSNSVQAGYQRNEIENRMKAEMAQVPEKER